MAQFGTMRESHLKNAGMIGLLFMVPVAVLWGLFSFGLLMKEGLAASLDHYGTGFTIFLAAGVIAALLLIGFLFDRRNQQT